MTRLITALAAVAALMALAPAAPVPKEEPYFPTAVGTRWTYRFEDPRTPEAAAAEVVEVVEEVVRSGRETFVVFGEPGKDGKVGCRYVMAVSDAGLHYGVNNVRAGPTLYHSFFSWELRLPAAGGDTWESDVCLGGSATKTVYTYHGVERVKVPAGEFRAAKVSCEEVTDRAGTRERRTA